MCQKSRRRDTLGIKWKFNEDKTKLGTELLEFLGAVLGSVVTVWTVSVVIYAINCVLMVRGRK